MQDKAWLLFVKIPLKNGSFFRLVRSKRHIHADGVDWQSCPIEIQFPSEEVEGSLGRLVIGVPNVSRMPIAYVEIDDDNGEGEILAATIECWLAHESSLATLPAGISWKHVALAVDADAKWARIDCGHPAGIGRGPRARFDRAKFPQMLPQVA